MNPMLIQQLYAQALGAQRQQQQPQDPRDAAYQNLRQIGMSHEQAIDTINQHMQQQAQEQQAPSAPPASGDDFLTNNANLQHQGHGNASAPLPDGGFTHD
jgi:hypothetical protein